MCVIRAAEVVVWRCDGFGGGNLRRSLHSSSQSLHSELVKWGGRKGYEMGVWYA